MVKNYYVSIILCSIIEYNVDFYNRLSHIINQFMHIDMSI